MHVNVPGDENKIRKISDGNTTEWNGGRRSVHEMIKRFQQVPDMHDNWRRICSEDNEPTSLDEHTKCPQNQRAHSQGNVIRDVTVDNLINYKAPLKLLLQKEIP